MVRIPEKPYGAVSGGRLQPSGGGSASSSFWRSLSSFGENIAGAAARLRSQREHDLLVEAQTSYFRQLREWCDSEMDEKPGALAEGHAGRFLERHGEAMDSALERLKEAGAESGEQAFANWAGERERTGFMEAARFEHAQMRTRASQTHEERLAEVFAAAKRNPLSCSDAVKQAEESYALAIGQGIMSPEDADKAFTRTREDLCDSSFWALYEQNPEQAMQSMDALGLAAEKRRIFAQRYDADKASAGALAEAGRQDNVAALGMRIEQAERQALMSGDPASLKELADAFTAVNETATADGLYSLSAMYERHSVAIGESGHMPLPALLARIEEGRGRMKRGGEGIGPDQKTGLEEELLLRGRIYEERKQALAADPAKEVGREVAVALSLKPEQVILLPGGTMGWPEPLTHEQLVDTRLAAQANNGISESERRVLSNAEVAAYRENWRSKDARGRLETALSLTAYGKHTGAVAQELGLRAAEELVLLRVQSDPRAVQALMSVIEANSAQASSAGRVMDPIEQGPVRDALELSQVVRAARAAEAALPGNARMRASHGNYVKTLSRLVEMEDGDVPSAVNMLDGRLKTLVNKDCALTFDPLVHGEAGFLRETLSRIKSDFPAVQGKAGEPSGSIQSGISPETHENSLWINAPDGDGFVLVELGGGNRILRVRTRDLREYSVQGQCRSRS